MVVYLIFVYIILIQSVLSNKVIRTSYNDNATTAENLNVTWKPPIVIPTETKHNGTIIFLHGIGDDPQKFANALVTIRQPYMKIVCPVANRLALAFNGGEISTAWFNIKTMGGMIYEDGTTLKLCTDYVRDIIDEEIKSGIKPERIIIGGVNQGAAFALHMGICYPKKLGGIVTYSAWLPLHTSFFHIEDSVNTNISVFQGHGVHDDYIPFIVGNATNIFLQRFSDNAYFKSYSELDHLVSDEVMLDLEYYMKKFVKP